MLESFQHQLRHIELKRERMRWRIAKASVIGTGHIKADMPCQDSHYVRVVGDTLIVAVSDGLGSAAHSEIGSALACEVATEYVAQQLIQATPARWQQLVQTLSGTAGTEPAYADILHAAFVTARQALEDEATRQAVALRDYACTLLMIVVTPHHWHSLHIGDGALVGLYADDSVQTLSLPDNGEFINVTVPLTSSEYLSHMRAHHKHEGLTGVAAVSDGVQPMCINFKTGAAYPGFFRPLIQWLRNHTQLSQLDDTLATMLDSEKLRQKSDDDMTLVIALREP
jgi:serine/threonine protein phosphatase PrpC